MSTFGCFAHPSAIGVSLVHLGSAVSSLCRFKDISRKSLETNLNPVSCISRRLRNFVQESLDILLRCAVLDL